jgi:hypothetical protein
MSVLYTIARSELYMFSLTTNRGWLLDQLGP